jgi:hypothetical protein
MVKKASQISDRQECRQERDVERQERKVGQVYVEKDKGVLLLEVVMFV